MKHYDSSKIANLEKLYRANLINSCTGYKSANLLATRTNEGNTNVAIFNSVTHIGSNPPMLGFILRPTTVLRNTYNNIKETGFFTVNHVNSGIIEEAHQSSAKYDENTSEFDETGLIEEYLDSFFAPYVKQSLIKMGCRYINEYLIKENNTLLIIAEIEHLYFDEKYQMADGWLQLEKARTVAVSGIDGYALPALLDRFQYARPGKTTESYLKNTPGKI